MTHFYKISQLIILLALILATGCEVLPQRRFKPTLHNPRMQLREVAIVPFLNRSGNSHVDGDEVAQLYANQVQRVPGYNVTPVETVKQAMIDMKLTRFESVEDIRALGRYLNVDAVVLGAVNQYSSYQPPTITLEVEWYATNPYFHPIVAGHGLPWGTPAEKEIPDAVLLQVEQDLARAQLATQTPDPKAVPLRSKTPDTQPVTFPAMPAGASPQMQQPMPPTTQPAAMPMVPQTTQTPQQSWSTIPGQNIPYTNAPDASYYPPALAPMQNDMGGNTFSPNGGASGQVITAYYPQQQFNTQDFDNYDNADAEETYDPETDRYLQRQQAALDELSQRGQGIFSRTKKMPKPDASRQYPPYETPVTLPSQRIPGTADSLGRSNLPQDASQTYAAQPLPVVMGSLPASPDYLAVMPGTPVGQGIIAGEPVAFPGLPANWPDPRGLIPDGPQATPQTDLTVNNEPVMRHVATYNGNDVNFTRRLADYESLFIDDQRIGGWQGILRRRTDFISACCCMHIWEMLSCRGGAGKAERVCKEDKFWMNP